MVRPGIYQNYPEVQANPCSLAEVPGALLAGHVVPWILVRTSPDFSNLGENWLVYACDPPKMFCLNISRMPGMVIMSRHLVPRSCPVSAAELGEKPGRTFQQRTAWWSCSFLQHLSAPVLKSQDMDDLHLHRKPPRPSPCIDCKDAGETLQICIGCMPVYGPAQSLALVTVDHDPSPCTVPWAKLQ